MVLRRTAAQMLLLACGLALGAADARAQILSAKRGFADVGAGYNNLQATGAGWYYTWGGGAGSPGNFNATHYPMVWGGTPSQGTINNIIASGAPYMLGFNEPERPDQANMSVAQAISAWTTISNGFAGSDVKLVSPAVSDTGDGQAWLSSFMNQAASNNLRVDAVAFHWYGVSNPNDPVGAANSFLSRVQSYYNSYNKPVFITEFAMHDWGGAYSDEAMIEANRQFLNIVIPQLESRSYVAGYAWYHWFSDAPLYTNVGGQLRPTPMGYTYTGVLTDGKTENIANKAYGEHVAWMAGGDLGQTSAGTASLKFINALEKASTIGGSVDWNVVNGGYVRVQSGATLRKTGANTVGLGTGTVTNNGVIEVTQGTLRIQSLLTGGTGAAVVVKGGTMDFAPAGRLIVPMTDVRNGGTLNVTGMNVPFTASSGRSVNVEAGALLVGNTTVGFSSTLSGGGAVNGNVMATNGAIIRVGKNGAGVARRVVVDNFESYALGDVRTVASPPWTAHQDTSLADIENLSGNKVLSYGFATGARGTSRTLPEATVLENNEQSTFFFRINSKTADPDHNVGLADKATTTGADFADFEAQLRLRQTSPASATTYSMDARNGGGFSTTLVSNLALNTWYNIWMVVDQTSDTYDLYMNTGTDAATAGNKLNESPLAFRNGTTSDLSTFLALGNTAPVDNGVRIDDIVFQTGIDLTNPLASFDPDLQWTPEMLTVNGDFSQEAGAILEMNLLSPAQHDVLKVTGQGAFNGTLNVTLAVGAAAPQAGDVFDILDVGTPSGAFAATNLPALSTGLLWDTSSLVSDGDLKVITVPGDFNFDGNVDGQDLLAWQRGESPMPGSETDLATWRGNYGYVWTAATASVAAVPEPTAGLMALLSWLAALVRGRRKAVTLAPVRGRR
jgi:hypothetical protein